MSSSAQHRHGVADQFLKPRYCRCEQQRVPGLLNGHVPDCPVPKYQQPAKLAGVKLPRTVAGLQRELTKLEAGFDALISRKGEAGLQEYVLHLEAIYLRMAELVCALPGQPNSMDKYMLVNFKEMLKIHAFYSVPENQRAGVEAKERLCARFGWEPSSHAHA